MKYSWAVSLTKARLTAGRMPNKILIGILLSLSARNPAIRVEITMTAFSA